MFFSRILILPAVIAVLAFGAAPAGADDEINTEFGLGVMSAYIKAKIKEAHYNPAVLDEKFFKAMGYFEPDNYPHLAFYRALPEIDWYRNRMAHDWVQANQPYYYNDFMEANRVTVAVVVESADDYVASMVADRVIARLPAHAIYNDDPGYSDIVISVRLGDMEPRYREKSRKPKSKKYKKEYRTKPPVEEQIHFANYTKVKESVSVALAYEFEISAGPQRISLDRSSMTYSDNFSYGVDFQAYGADGPVENAPYPSKKVYKLVERDAETVRSGIATRLVNQASARVATMLKYDALPLRYELRDRYRQSSGR